MVNRMNKLGRAMGAIKTVSQGLLGKKLARAANARAVEAVSMPSYKKGGKVKKTGKAKLHKNEVVLPVGAVKMLKRLMQ